MPATRPRAYQVYDIDWKQSVKAVSIAPIDVTTIAPLTIDNVAINAFDRILLVGQTDASQNGVWQLNANRGLVRGIDFQNDGTGLRPTVESGVTVTVEQGQYYAFSIWELQTPNPIQLGTTALTFAQQNNYVGNGTPVGGAVQLSIQPGNRKGSSENFYLDLNYGSSANAGNLIFANGNINVNYGNGNRGGGITTQGGLLVGGDFAVRGDAAFLGNSFANVLGRFSGNVFATSIQPIRWDGTRANANQIVTSNAQVDVGSPTTMFRNMYAEQFITPAGQSGGSTLLQPNPASGASGVAFTDSASGEAASVAAGPIASSQDITAEGDVYATNLFLDTDARVGNSVLAEANVIAQTVTARGLVNGNTIVGNISISAPLITASNTLQANQVNTDTLNFANGQPRVFISDVGVDAGELTRVTTNPAPGVFNIQLGLADTAVTPGTYAPRISGNPANTTQSAQITVDRFGRITAAASSLVTPAFSSITDTPTTLAGYGITDAVNVVRLANAQIGGEPGVATLDLTGKIPVNQLPSIAISNTFVVNTYQDLTTLTTAELGDVGIVVNDPDIYRFTSNLSTAGATTINFSNVANIEVEQQVLRVANGVQIFGFGTTVTNVDVGNNRVTFSQGLLANLGASANVQFISFYDDTSWILANAAPNGYANINNWVQLRFPVPVISVNGKTGAVSLVPQDVGAAANTIQIIAANGLSGGGNLQQNVTLGLGNLAATGMLTPGTYGNTSYVPVLTVDQYGRVANVELAPVDQTIAIVMAIALG